MRQHKRNLKILVLTAACSALSLLATGCVTSSGSQSVHTNTGIILGGKNYKVIKAAATGESKGFFLFGFIPFRCPNYAEAKQALYQSLGTDVTGRPIAVVNQSQDESSLYLVLFSVPKLTVTADVIEFTW